MLHQAAIPSVPRSVEDPITSNRANIDATFREKRAAVDPSRLAIIAFAQDDATHAVLQTAFAHVR